MPYCAAMFKILPERAGHGVRFVGKIPLGCLGVPVWSVPTDEWRKLLPVRSAARGYCMMNPDVIFPQSGINTRPFGHAAPNLRRSIQGSDTQILYYVTGALIRSELAMRKCGSCRALLTRNSGAAELLYLTVEGVVTPNVSDFLNEINRGGLLIPSDLAFSIGVKCWLVFTCIKDSPENGCPEVKNSFIACNCQVWLFTVLVTRLLAEDSVFCEAAVTQLVCDSTSHHGFCRSLVQRFYNCFANNFVKEVGGSVVYSGIVPSDALKIAKLQSESVK